MEKQPSFSFSGSVLLEKFPGKGGSTFARIPGAVLVKDNPFGWMTVSGEIDGYMLDRYKLMPMGDGKLFLPVKAAIRKVIKKEAGDTVLVHLFSDDRPPEIPQEWLDCLELEPEAKERFFQLGYSAQKQLIDHIYEAKTEATKVKRMAEIIKQLEKDS